MINLTGNPKVSTVYGPVPSWRFGRSLGIDVVLPPKTCSFNCIYCQLGRTQKGAFCPEELHSYVTTKQVEADLKKYMTSIDLDTVDVVTFSGSGEPTLNPELGRIVKRVRQLISGRLPIVLLTNSSLLYREEVRRNVALFDVVVVKMDAADEKAYKTINRPIKGAPSIRTIKESIKKLKEETNGKIMTQTMFLRTSFGFTNCEGETSTNLVRSLVEIAPDVIQVDTPYRPGGEKFVRPVSVEELKTVAERIKEYMTKSGGGSEIWVFGVHDMRGRKVAWKEHERINQEIIELLKRRPCRLEDMADSLGISYSETDERIRDLLQKGLVKKKISEGEEFYHLCGKREA